MTKTKTRKRWKLFAGMAALVMVLASFMAMPVQAVDTTVTVGLVSGGLVLRTVPDMNFGTANTISTSTLNLSPADTLDYIIKVEDLRGGAAATGWNLTVNLDTFACATVVSDSLPGANLTISTASVVTTDTANPAVAATGVTLTSGGSPVKVLHAEATKGLLENTCTWGLADVKLNIPASGTHVPETHTANLVWTLTDGPGT